MSLACYCNNPIEFRISRVQLVSHAKYLLTASRFPFTPPVVRLYLSEGAEVTNVKGVSQSCRITLTFCCHQFVRCRALFDVLQHITVFSSQSRPDCGGRSVFIFAK